MMDRLTKILVVLALLFVAWGAWGEMRVDSKERDAERADSIARIATERAREAEDSLSTYRAGYEAVRDTVEALGDSLAVVRRREIRARSVARDAFDRLEASVPDSARFVPRETFDSVVAISREKDRAADRIIATLEADTARYRMLWLRADSGWAQAEAVIAEKNEAIDRLMEESAEWEEAYRRASDPPFATKVLRNIPGAVIGVLGAVVATEVISSSVSSGGDDRRLESWRVEVPIR